MGQIYGDQESEEVVVWLVHLNVPSLYKLDTKTLLVFTHFFAQELFTFWLILHELVLCMCQNVQNDKGKIHYFSPQNSNSGPSF